MTIHGFTRPDAALHQRRLSDRIRDAFDHACRDGELETAGNLLRVLEDVLLQEPPLPDRREAVVSPLLAFHARLWRLKAESQGKEASHKVA